jgi:hypothetical protein
VRAVLLVLALDQPKVGLLQTDVVRLQGPEFLQAAIDDALEAIA